MPVRIFSCSCGHSEDVYRKLSASLSAKLRCPACSRRTMRLNLAAEIVTKQVGARTEIKPFFSNSMGCLNKSERIPGEVYSADNRILVRDKKHRAELMKRTGNVVDRRDFKDRTPTSHRNRARYAR